MLFYECLSLLVSVSVDVMCDVLGVVFLIMCEGVDVVGV